MVDLKFKTRVLNEFRKIAMLPFVERLLVRFTQNKNPQNFYTKLIPNNYQYPPNTLRFCERNGIRFSLDISDYMQYCLYFGIKTEPRERLYSLVEEGTTIIDVGTNIGETLLNFALLNKRGVNIGFEPVPFLFERAKENIRLNRAENIVLLNLALSNDNSTLFFNYVNNNNSGGIFLTSETTMESASSRVQSIRLDDYVACNNTKNISLIKIDVEGFEMKVLQGAIQTIKKHKPTLFLELDNNLLRKQQSNARELIDFIKSFDYEIFKAENGRVITENEELAGKHFDIVCQPGKTGNSAN